MIYFTSALAVQHVNGTLEPVAVTVSSPKYRSLMGRLLLESKIYPYGYGYGLDLPEDLPPCLRVQQQESDVNILFDEISKLISIAESQRRTILHYSVSSPIFFTPSHDVLLSSALQLTDLPEPLFSQPADFAAFTALNTTSCLRHFEFDCEPIDYNPKTIILLEYSNLTLSGSLYYFWGSRYPERVAYFADPNLGNGSSNDLGHWKALIDRIVRLIEDHQGSQFGSFKTTRPIDIVLLGQLASDPEFHAAMRDAIAEIMDGHVPLPGMLGDTVLDPIFVSALGAARGAKSMIDRPAPRGCNVEEESCSLLRKKVLDDSFVGNTVGDENFREL